MMGGTAGSATSGVADAYVAEAEAAAEAQLTRALRESIADEDARIARAHEAAVQESIAQLLLPPPSPAAPQVPPAFPHRDLSPLICTPLRSFAPFSAAVSAATLTAAAPLTASLAAAAVSATTFAAATLAAAALATTIAAAASPPPRRLQADSELDAVLEQLEDDNHIMFRDWVIHRI